MVELVVAATELVEDGIEAEIYEDPEGFMWELKWRNEDAWFANLEVGDVVVWRLLRLAMVARQGWLERLSRGPEDKGSLANAVDGLLNVVECRFDGDEEVMERHWGNKEGWEFVEGCELERAWEG